jgi:pilus assembly protein CpaB
MRIIAILVLVFGVALAGGAVFFASKYYDEMKASMAQKGPDTVRVLVAKKSLAYGAQVTAESLQWVEWPKQAVPAGAFTSIEGLFGKNKNEKRIVLRGIEAGEPILDARITKFGESPRVAMNLGEGMRAVSIRIDDVSGVSGFVAPGDRVDILLTRTIENNLVSSVILQEIAVIAVDQQSSSETSGPRLGRTVTFEVNTNQAQRLALAQQVGRLSLTLRGFGEATDEKMAPVTADQLSDLGAAPKEEISKVRVRRGTQLSDVRIDGSTESSADGQGEPAPAPAPAN